MNVAGVSVRMKKFFFDRATVEKRIGAKRARFMRNVGGYCQKTAQRSMRRAGKKAKPSPAGQPPRYHGANPSLRTIYYALDPATDSMVVGPILLNGGKGKGRQPLPGLMEGGGTQPILEKRVGKAWVPIGRRTKPGQPVRKRNAVYPPRPTMLPAARKTIKRFPELMRKA